MFIYLAEQNQLSLNADKVGIPQIKKVSAMTDLPIIRKLQNIKHVIQEQLEGSACFYNLFITFFTSCIIHGSPCHKIN